jgi:DNA-binding transcriptional ArsR family regulator
VSKHLVALDEAGLVERTLVGREVRYSAVLEPLTDVTTWVSKVGDEWDARLQRLRHL